VSLPVIAEEVRRRGGDLQSASLKNTSGSEKRERRNGEDGEVNVTDPIAVQTTLRV
jgi:hypothetical protein